MEEIHMIVNRTCNVHFWKSGVVVETAKARAKYEGQFKDTPIINIWFQEKDEDFVFQYQRKQMPMCFDVGDVSKTLEAIEDEKLVPFYEVNGDAIVTIKLDCGYDGRNASLQEIRRQKQKEKAEARALVDVSKNC
jgi:hypothetical protein